MSRIDRRNFSRYRHSPGIAGVDLLLADFTTHEYAPHVHDSLVIAVTEAGGSEFRSRGRTELATPDALLVFNPGEPHSGRMAGSRRWRYRSFYFADAGLKQVLALLHLNQAVFFTTNVLADASLVRGFLSLHQALDAGSDLLLEQELLVRSFSTLFARHGSRPGASPGGGAAAVRPAIELMRQAYAERLTLERLAEEARLPAHRLIASFRHATGLTPHAYLTQVRLRAALRELAAGRSTVDAAVSCGFYDQSALHKSFKRTFGMTPLQYTREVRR